MSERSKILVVGGGYRGIKASLKYADSEEVYLVEKSPKIGGFFSKLHLIDGGAASETLLPGIERLKQKENIHILTNTVIEGVEKENGSDSRINVNIRRKPIRVDVSKCDNCGECWKICPVKPPDRFNEWLINRNAIYSAGEGFSYAIEKETPFCQATCPVNLDIRGYVGLIADGKFKEAYKLIREKNPFPGICGRVCTHPCEDRCKRGLIDEPISIAKLKRFVADYVYKRYEDEKPKPVSATKGKKVAIIGAGPAGLTAAHDLKIFGYDVTVFEKLPVAGGMMAAGIPEYRLPREILGKEIEYIKTLGVEIRVNEEVDKEKFEKQRKEYDAIFISVGAHISRKLGVEGEDLEGVIHGVDFLRDLKFGREVKIGKRVAVIGGGNVAMDAARCALRLGAEVFIVYRRSRAEMPASKEEIEALEKEGIKIYFLATPTKIMGLSGVEKMECIRMELGAPDKSGRRRPIPIEGSEFIMDVDTIIPAIGQSSNLKFLEGSGVDTPKGRWIKALKGGKTNVDGIFAGGDAVTGPATVIEAIAAGKKAALSINKYLEGEERGDFEVESEIDLDEYEEWERKKLLKNHFSVKEIEKKRRAKMPELPIKERIKNFGEVELGYDESIAMEEAKRCLSCRKCIGCGICAEVCVPRAIEYDQREERKDIKVDEVILAPDIEEGVPPEEYMYSNVVTLMEFERILDESGPYGGIIMKPYDGDIPMKIAFIQVDDNEFSPISFKYILQQAISAKEKGINCSIFTKNKNYDEEIKREEEKGIRFVQVEDDVEIIEKKDTKKLLLLEEEFDMVVLSTGFYLPKHVIQISKLMGISPEELKFYEQSIEKITIKETQREGVFVAI